MAAKQVGAERIIAMRRHADWQKVAHLFVATDKVTERGDEGVARTKDLTHGIGARSTIETVGIQRSMTQAISSIGWGGHLCYIGVGHDVQLAGGCTCTACLALRRRS